MIPITNLPRLHTRPITVPRRVEPVAPTNPTPDSTTRSDGR
jgi:hypothetical protein